ncbi:MAG: response regulator transcription factor [Acidobacteriota bacterium]|nr:response regulator transcription factor [Acidobacteriota bacterium]
MRPVGTETVAVVEDEATIREAVGVALTREGYRVKGFEDGREAWESFQQELPGLAILDIVMPRMDGLELCRKLRSKSEVVPIIFLSSRDEELDRVLGLELGADDYLCKPFSVRELVARVKVLFRRAALIRSGEPAEPEKLLSIGPMELDLQRYTASWKGQAVALTVTEFLLLQSLVRHPGHVKTRRQLMTDAYPHDGFVSERTIDSHIKRLRRKFVEREPAFSGIETVHGLGYRYEER